MENVGEFMQNTIILALLTVLITAPSPARAGDLPETKAALVDAAMAAISNNDVATYLALFPRHEALVAHCPVLMSDPEMERAVREIETKAEPNIRRMMKGCHELIDFARAERVAVEGGERKAKPEKGCKDLYELTDILVRVRVGEKTFRIKIDDHLVIGESQYGVMDDPRCTPE